MTNGDPGAVSVAMPDVLAGGGELGALMRAFDWASNPLGPPERWPQSLRTAVRIMLTSRQPIWVGWGPELIYLYNDAYKAIIGGKHPWALGRPTEQVWSEIWADIHPMLTTAMGGVEGIYVEQQRLIMERHGYPEETYYTFSYSPIPDDRGLPGGVICANTDDTQRVIGERQVALLRDLAAKTSPARTWQEACRFAAEAFAYNPYDLPFAAIYVLDRETETLSLAAQHGLAPDHPAIRPSVQLSDWGTAADALAHNRPVVDDDVARFGDLPSGAWPDPPRQIAILPIPAAGESGRTGVLMVGLNPFRLFDDNYRGFLELTSGQVSAALANASAYEDERRRAEALAEIDRAKTAFFSNVSHEFRTPLTLMLGPLEEALSDAEAPPAVRAQLDIAHRNGVRLLKLVNTLLDFSRMEAGRMEARFRPVDLGEIVADLASTFRSVTERAGLTLDVEIEPGLEPVFVDVGMIEKIVLNLLSNAFKFTLEGGITVRVASGAAPDTVEIRVVDTGVGIPASEIPRLFERFHRVQGSQGRSFEGSGIGLALVHELVQLHGGAISAESEEGEGAAFTVTLPTGSDHLPAEHLAPATEGETRSASARAFAEESLRWLPDLQVLSGDAAAAVGDRSRILLADDNADMRDYVVRLLTSAGFEVTAAPDGAAALAAIRETPPDLVLTDVMMPRLDGFGLLREIRADRELADLPVIMLSARAGEEAAVEGLDAGADDYLSKPFTARELLARVSANLALSRARRETADVLAARNAELEVLLDTAPVCIFFTYDTEAREVRSNRFAAELMRMPVAPGNTSVTATGDDRPTHFRLLQNGVEIDPREAPVQRAARGEETRNEEVEIRFEDGSSIHMLLNATPLWDEQGAPRGAIAVGLDITGRRRIEAEREAANRELQDLNANLEQRIADTLAERRILADIVEGTDAFVQVVDMDFRWLAINRAAAREFETIFGVRPKAGDSMVELLAGQPDQQAAVRAVWARALAGEEFTEVAEFGAHDRRCYEMKYNVLRNGEGRQIGAYQFVYDVTARIEEQRRLALAEEQLRQAQKMEAMGQLTGGVAHDFNNLLTPIIGALDMLQRKGVGQEREQRLIDGALQSADRARTLVQRLLAFARRQPLQPVSIDVGALVAGMADLVSTTTGPQIHVAVEASPDLQPARADPNQLEMALLNLCVNARDAMPNGGTIRITATNAFVPPGDGSELIPGPYVRLSVADTGVGMDETTLARAVEPFFSTKGIGKGTGLGLSMAHGLAQQLGGGLRITSRPGLGTNVELWLPRSDEPLRQKEADPVAAEVKAARGVALLVDDEPVVRASIADMLIELGYVVVEADSADEALGRVRAGLKPAVMVTDHMMPGLTGIELAYAVRAEMPGLPVLIISGYADLEGIDPTFPRLTKPFLSAELSAALAHLPEGAAKA